MTNQAGSVEIGAGEVLYADGPLSKPGVLSTPLRLPVDESEPQPEMLPLFNSLPAITGGEGLFVLVHDGRIALTQGGQSIEISKGESAFAGADGTTLQKLETSPSFLSRDPQLRTVNFDAFSCTLP
jgi:hypothetical protein